MRRALAVIQVRGPVVPGVVNRTQLEDNKGMFPTTYVLDPVTFNLTYSEPTTVESSNEGSKIQYASRAAANAPWQPSHMSARVLEAYTYPHVSIIDGYDPYRNGISRALRKHPRF